MGPEASRDARQHCEPCRAGPEDFLAGYCGLHGLAQGLQVVVGAAERLKDRPDIKIIMVGDGPVKDELVRSAAEKNLTSLKLAVRFDRNVIAERAERTEAILAAVIDGRELPDVSW